MQFLKDVYSWNYPLSVALTGWLVAQVFKTIINALLLGKFDWERMVGSGGMPSSHSSTVCALVIAIGKTSGTRSPLFAIAFVLSLIVMYDAMGVRRETGKQAQILNQMITKWMDEESKRTPLLGDKKLKEMVGHTPFEVVAGAILGIAIGFIIPVM